MTGNTEMGDHPDVSAFYAAANDDATWDGVQSFFVGCDRDNCQVVWDAVATPGDDWLNRVVDGLTGDGWTVRVANGKGPWDDMTCPTCNGIPDDDSPDRDRAIAALKRG